MEALITGCYVIYGSCCYLLCLQVAAAKKRSPGTWGIVGFLTGLLGVIAIAGMPTAETAAVSEEGDDTDYFQFGIAGVIIGILIVILSFIN